MKKTNKEKMRTIRLVEPSEQAEFRAHTERQKEVSEEIQQKVSRLIEKWEDDDWKNNSLDDVNESIHYEWGNNTRH
ncbi:MAG: hypothetical protein OEX83_02615 [Gammaproteobacteria bacterium]|nr:hypothetical protein [Gammaproteobacteria bacterium]